MYKSTSNRGIKIGRLAVPLGIAFLMTIVAITVAMYLFSGTVSPTPPLSTSTYAPQIQGPINEGVLKIERIGNTPIDEEALLGEDDHFLIQFINRQEGWVIWEGKLWRTRNGGGSWELIYDVSPDYIRKLQFIDSQIGWLIASGKMYKTENGGDTWIEFIQPIPLKYEGNLLSFQFLKDGKHGWVVGGLFILLSEREKKIAGPPTRYTSPDRNRGLRGVVYHTVNGGQDWQQELISSGWGYISDLFFLDAEYGWATGTAGTFYLKDNWWKPTKSQAEDSEGNIEIHSLDVGLGAPSCEPTHIFFLDERLGWLSNTNGYLAKSSDGGRTWQDIWNIRRSEADRLYLFLNKMNFISSMDGWGTGSDGRLYRTKDGGKSWENLNASVKFLTLCFLDDHYGLAVAKEGLFLLHLP